ncbi:hypothetical protein EC973_003083 [Apophysomyces ossiformis]|uniref:Uncharacterized protein n=1 Tax=Apophysomyces ossiformis TaxID=679940 RepID=A0A8H7ELB8_9FUNG|nr:hypothetical protein EC973_003083 [Apophysomyces ossiformis]
MTTDTPQNPLLQQVLESNASLKLKERMRQEAQQMNTANDKLENDYKTTNDRLTLASSSSCSNLLSGERQVTVWSASTPSFTISRETNSATASDSPSRSTSAKSNASSESTTGTGLSLDASSSSGMLHPAAATHSHAPEISLPSDPDPASVLSGKAHDNNLSSLHALRNAAAPNTMATTGASVLTSESSSSLGSKHRYNETFHLGTTTTTINVPGRPAPAPTTMTTPRTSTTCAAPVHEHQQHLPSKTVVTSTMATAHPSFTMESSSSVCAAAVAPSPPSPPPLLQIPRATSERTGTAALAHGVPPIGSSLLWPSGQQTYATSCTSDTIAAYLPCNDSIMGRQPYSIPVVREGIRFKHLEDPAGFPSVSPMKRVLHTLLQITKTIKSMGCKGMKTRLVISGIPRQQH